MSHVLNVVLDLHFVERTVVIHIENDPYLFNLGQDSYISRDIRLVRTSHLFSVEKAQAFLSIGRLLAHHLLDQLIVFEIIALMICRIIIFDKLYHFIILGWLRLKLWSDYLFKCHLAMMMTLALRIRMVHIDLI